MLAGRFPTKLMLNNLQKNLKKKLHSEKKTRRKHSLISDIILGTVGRWACQVSNPVQIRQKLSDRQISNAWTMPTKSIFRISNKGWRAITNY